jgi:hypothetical protein
MGGALPMLECYVCINHDAPEKENLCQIMLSFRDFSYRFGAIWALELAHDQLCV